MAKMIKFVSKEEQEKRHRYANIMDKLKIKQLFGDYKNTIECAVFRYNNGIDNDIVQFKLEKTDNNIVIDRLAPEAIFINYDNTKMHMKCCFSKKYNKSSIFSTYTVNIAINEDKLSISELTESTESYPVEDNKFIKEDKRINLSENSYVLEQTDKSYYVVVLFCPVNNIPLVRIYNEDVYENVSNDDGSLIETLLNINDYSLLFNSWNEKIDFYSKNTEYKETIIENKSIKIMKYNDRFDNVIGSVDGIDVSYNKDGSVKEFTKVFNKYTPSINKRLLSADIDYTSKVLLTEYVDDSFDINTTVKNHNLPIDEYPNLYKDGKLNIEFILKSIDELSFESNEFGLPKEYYNYQTASETSDNKFEYNIKKTFDGKLNYLFDRLKATFGKLNIFAPSSYSINKIENSNGYVIVAHYNSLGGVYSRNIDTTLSILYTEEVSRVSIVSKHKLESDQSKYYRFIATNMLFSEGSFLVNMGYTFVVSDDTISYSGSYEDITGSTVYKNLYFDNATNKAKLSYESPELSISCNIPYDTGVPEIENFFSQLYCRTDNFVYIKDRWGIPRKFNIN